MFLTALFSTFALRCKHRHSRPPKAIKPRIWAVVVAVNGKRSVRAFKTEKIGDFAGDIAMLLEVQISPGPPILEYTNFYVRTTFFVLARKFAGRA